MCVHCRVLIEKCLLLLNMKYIIDEINKRDLLWWNYSSEKWNRFLFYKKKKLWRSRRRCSIFWLFFVNLNLIYKKRAFFFWRRDSFLSMKYKKTFNFFSFEFLIDALTFTLIKRENALKIIYCFFNLWRMFKLNR